MGHLQQFDDVSTFDQVASRVIRATHKHQFNAIQIGLNAR
ncbi:Uncharacterised protein [Vibrio cholerae]|nr:Uncharacterised protein [Vibrio cholerae]